METRHRVPVFDGVEAEGESEPLGELLDGVELVAVTPDAAVLLLQLVELVDEGLDHRLGTIRLVVLSSFIQRVLREEM